VVSGSRGRENLYHRRDDINRYPDRHHFHEVGAATCNDEKPKRQEHPVKGNVAPCLVNQVRERDGDRKICDPDEGIRNHVGPHQAWIPQIAEQMRQEIGRQQALG
jgi:hypothetical protein